MYSDLPMLKNSFKVCVGIRCLLISKVKSLKEKMNLLDLSESYYLPLDTWIYHVSCISSNCLASIFDHRRLSQDIRVVATAEYV